MAFYKGSTMIAGLGGGSDISAAYPVDALFFTSNSGSVCPIQSSIPGSTWEQVGTLSLSGGGTAYIWKRLT